MCVIRRWIKQGVTAVESPAAQTLNAASFRGKTEVKISEEINWQEGKFKLTSLREFDGSHWASSRTDPDETEEAAEIQLGEVNRDLI